MRHEERKKLLDQLEKLIEEKEIMKTSAFIGELMEIKDFEDVRSYDTIRLTRLMKRYDRMMEEVFDGE